MQSAILVLHLMIALVLIALVLMQRSEGGALGIGGGGGGGGGFSGMMGARGATSGLVRITVYLAAGFFLTSIALSWIGNSGGGSVLDAVDVEQSGAPSGGGLSLPLGAERAPPPAAPQEPAGQPEPAEPTEPTVPLSR